MAGVASRARALFFAFLTGDGRTGHTFLFDGDSMTEQQRDAYTMNILAAVAMLNTAAAIAREAGDAEAISALHAVGEAIDRVVSLGPQEH